MIRKRFPMTTEMKLAAKLHAHLESLKATDTTDSDDSVKTIPLIIKLPEEYSGADLKRYKRLHRNYLNHLRDRKNKLK